MMTWKMTMYNFLKKWEALLKALGTISAQNDVHEKNILILKNQLVEKEDLVKEGLAWDENLYKELEELNKQIWMMDPTSTLAQILESGRLTNVRRGLGYLGETVRMPGPIFVPASLWYGSAIINARRIRIPYIPTCHF